MLLLDKSVCTPDAQCNAKMCALAESLQRMYDITSPKRASPRRNTLVDPLSLYIYIYIYIYTIGPDRQPGQQLAGQLSSKDQESDARAWGRMPGLVSHLFQICIFMYLYICVYMFPSTSSH